MVRRDAGEVGVAGIGADAFEEHAHLGLPPLQVGPEDFDLFVVCQLGCLERLISPSHPQLSPARDAQVSHPLGLPPWGYEVMRASEGEQIRRCRPPLAAVYAL